MQKKKIHVCGENEKWCYNCKLADAVDHKCFILTEDELIERDKRLYKNGKKKESKFSGYIFFDIETVVEANKIHVPNLIMAAKRCVDCLNCEELCSQCNIKYEFDNVKDFGDWLMSHENYIIFAHNLKGFDGCFILKYILENLLPQDKNNPVHCIVTGTKIMSISYLSLKFIDSLNFIPGALESFPKTFGIAE